MMEAVVQNSSRPIPVIATVIIKEAAYLLCKRPSHKRHGNLWEFPGGKIKTGESFENAARREIKEELGAELISVRGLLDTVRDPASPFLIHFVAADISGDPEPIEHQEIGWFKVDELQNLPLAPADAEFVRKKMLPPQVKKGEY